jgi:RHS repeat-associated protein
VSYTYDNGSRLTGINYQLGSTSLGNLTYSYDQLGRRTQVSGSFARTGLPGAVTSAVYDAANEVTNWNGFALSYDQNGNMLSDGANTFTWNARNQVAKLNNVSLQYDAFGRRIQNAGGTSFLYDGANAVQELSGSTVTANLLSGGIDEVFDRTDASGAFTQLKDALGSTIALADANGNIQTAYTYDPYGNTSVTGTSNGNEFQYTGRENEGNGLYFYRARYYSPLLGRFISEDPIGFGGGLNLYSYVFDSPTNFADPSGNCPTCLAPPPPTAPPPVVTVPITVGAGAGTAAAAGEGSAPVMTLVAGGSAEGSGAGPIGVVVGIGVAATRGIIYQKVKYNQAIDNEDAAYDTELQAIHKMNQALLTHPKLRPLPLPGEQSLAGRKNSSEEEESEECFLDDQQPDPDYPGWNRCRYWCPNSGGTFTYRSRGDCPKTIRQREQ